MVVEYRAIRFYKTLTSREQVVGCYSQSKALATQAVLDAVREKGLHACVVHPSGILGPEDFAVGETTETVIQIINGEMRFPLESFLSF